ncbi:MAG: NADPH:quinone oxidoreductase family protein [Actinomycetia bacterium]|nr:NADPH:quinone oxidoreductase family protein [Actinomycetes bacterium]MCP5028878.1 NADPH:quinone oxidoreductase family protein [Actinomycetes bacterium]
MRAVVLKEFGSPEALVFEERETPTPGPGEIVIDTRAVPVTFPDCLMLEDKYQFKADLPFVPCSELAGDVSAVGEGVEGLAVGDRVVASTGVVGALAEQVLVPAAAARLIPDSVGYGESTSLQYAYGTGYYGLKYRGQLKEGDTLLITGAGGHVGMAAIELGKLMGATVIAAASSEEKLASCRERGADHTINYSEENLKERAKELTGGKGVNVVFDCVGGDYAEQALRAIAWEGRFLVIGFAAGIPRIPLNLTLLKGCQVVGVFLAGLASMDPELSASISNDLLGFLADGSLRSQVAGRFTLDEAPAAFRSLMDRKAVGKVVIEP